jgi:putative spermidine/putrescine transport system ATP-binding protein
LVLASNGVALRGTAGNATARPAGGDAASGAIRAEQIRIAADSSALAGLDTIVAGQVSDAIFEGERVVYEVAVRDLGGTMLRVFDHDPAGHAQFEIGSAVSLGWNGRDLLVFA